jgi:hypothetical protein
MVLPLAPAAQSSAIFALSVAISALAIVVFATVRRTIGQDLRVTQRIADALMMALGTALEYLESVLPASIRQRLWPFLVEGRVERPFQPRAQVIADLLRSSSSITVQLGAQRNHDRFAASAG